MKTLGTFGIMVGLSMLIGAWPLLIGLALLYALAAWASRPAGVDPARPASPTPPPPFGSISRKVKP